MSDEKPYIIEKQAAGEVPGVWVPCGEIRSGWGSGALRDFFELDGAVLKAGRYRVIEKYTSFGSRVVREFDVEVVPQKPSLVISEVEFELPPSEQEPGTSVPMSAVPEPGA